ncbi:hypothetical protein E2C01_083845 [Portunus trituberculatus]|uniref:Uncharacterized protein n=1 Tax=Portunus trituberculatus TaxID=210409 RepID=A0A5B7ITK0_PORTR|nr:hypothetical protein [Portunus trituberculatus]
MITDYRTKIDTPSLCISWGASLPHLGQIKTQDLDVIKSRVVAKGALVFLHEGHEATHRHATPAEEWFKPLFPGRSSTLSHSPGPTQYPSPLSQPSPVPFPTHLANPIPFPTLLAQPSTLP